LGNVNEARQLATNGIRFSPSPSYLLHLHERDKMSINELIATNGKVWYRAGQFAERSRAIRLAQHISVPSEPAIGQPREMVFLDDLIAYLADEDEK